jgi:four helix bundle protein
MATVKCFEDLICWQKARELTRFIYQITASADFSRDFGLRDQIRRAAVSVMSNIAEGFDRGTKMELINFFFIAKGSCGEVKSQLYISQDIGYIDILRFREGIKLCDEVSRLIQSFILKAKAGAWSGLQYKKAPGFSYEKWLKEKHPDIYEKLPFKKEDI